MNLSTNLSRVLCFFLLMPLMALVTSCSDEEDLQTGNGYVQFKIYKSASYEKHLASRASTAQLDFLNDAKKVKIMLKGTDFSFSQTLTLSAFDKNNAEYGLRSEKLELLPGEYTITGFYLYGKVDDVLYVGQPSEKTTFVVENGGLVMQDLLVNAVNRGYVQFKLVKHFVETLSTRADDDEEMLGNFTMARVNKVNITLQNMDTKEVLAPIKDLKVKIKQDFTGEGDGSTTTFGEIDSLVNVRAGRYKVYAYELYDKKTLLEVNSEPKEEIFVVKDNEKTEANVPLTINKQAPYIKDYIALYNIWQKMNGEEWSYVGQNFPLGVNWSFDDKDIDMWGDQPGVGLDDKGRVTFLSIGDFGAKGVVPAEIGELTELQTLMLGTHNDLLRQTEPLLNVHGKLTQEDKKQLRADYYDKYVKIDPRDELSEPLKYGLKLKGEYTPSKDRKANGIAPKDVIWGDLTNGITGIDKAIGKLQKLEVLFIANAPITELPDELGDLKACTDLELYNCPKMVNFPKQIARMEKLTQLNLAMNKQINGTEFKEGLAAMADGAAGKSLQIIYLGFNNITELPDNVSKFKKLGKIDCVFNKLKKVPAFGKDVNLVQASFDHNQIETIETVDNGEGKQIFCGMEDVESLSFSHNNLTKLPNIFDVNSIYIMASVNFGYNEITDAGLEGFNGINVSNLSLNHNKLTKFPGQLINAGSPLVILNLSANKISEFKGKDLEGKNAFMLSTLDLTYNRLKKLPTKFNGHVLPYLYGLDLSGNQMDEFPWSAVDISYLTVLGLRDQRDDDGNRIFEEWPTNIGNHIGLRALFLGGNNIGKVPETEKLSYMISMLDISDNPNIILNVSSVCPYIKMGMYMLIYDSTQDIRGCDALDLD